MDKVNLKDILDGEITEMPFELDCVERHEFAIALSDALYTMQETDFPGIANDCKRTPADIVFRSEPDFRGWDVITDNYLAFLLNEANKFSVENLVGAFIRAVRIHRVTFNPETETFNEFFEVVCPWIVCGPYEDDGRGVSAQPPQTEGFGGHFTLRGRNKPEKNQ